MHFSAQILEEYRRHADRRVAFVCRWMIVFMLGVSLLNDLGIFKVQRGPLLLITAVSVVNFALPTLFDRLWGGSPAQRYLILTILVVQSGLQYAVLSYHTILMLAFPLVLSCLYNEKRYVVFTAALSLPMIILSHLAALQLGIVTDEPLVTLRGTVLYGILPRSIEFLAFFVVCYYISNRIEQLVGTLAAKNTELYEDQVNLIFSLSQIIENKSRSTGQHVRRVSEYTKVLCKSLGYSDEACWKISLAAMMHDVGKLMIPESILEKPGR